jgi:hypothetical protein
MIQNEETRAGCVAEILLDLVLEHRENLEIEEAGGVNRRARGENVDNERKRNSPDRMARKVM